jgi:hypothetical protein
MKLEQGRLASEAEQLHRLDASIRREQTYKGDRISVRLQGQAQEFEGIAHPHFRAHSPSEAPSLAGCCQHSGASSMILDDGDFNAKKC